MKKKIVVISVLLICLIILSVVSLIEYDQVRVGMENIEITSNEVISAINRKNNAVAELVNSVKKYTIEEDDLISKISNDKKQIENTQDIKQLENLNMNITKNVQELLEKIEQYPQIMDSRKYIEANNNLVECQNDLKSSLEMYNLSIKTYNSRRKLFPINLMNYEENQEFEMTELSLQEINTENQDVDIQVK